MSDKNTIIFDHVEKTYQKNTVIRDLNLTIPAGQRLILLGPSGCGKSTTLRMIAGLEEITGGELRMGDRRVNEVPSGKRDIAMVFQNYALYPHMTVRENITYTLRVHKLDRAELETRLHSVLEILGLEPYVQRKPRELSGGQRQRVALARALVKQSRYLLLDEPLSNLDAQLRVQARKELVKIHDLYQQTFVYVTHDQVEAMTVGQRVALMNQGVLQMVDTPYRVYNRPANIFTAKFIGSPSTNILDADWADGVLHVQGQQIRLPDCWSWLAERSGEHELCLGIRPEHIRLQAGRADVLTHAVMDALTGAARLGDIGQLFPNTDPAYAGASSLGLLAQVGRLLREKGYAVVNIDATLIAQAPKVGPYKQQMARNLAQALGISPEQVNVKATTEEHLGFTGDGSGMAAHAVVLVEQIQ